MYSIVIPTYGDRGIKLTEGCLDSLRCLQMPHEIVVVDDGSPDDVVEKLAEVCDRDNVALYHNTENMGFAKTCNAGITESDGQVVILLNNDIRITYPVLDMLYIAVVSFNAGVMGIRLLYPNYTIQHAGVFFDPQRQCFDHYCRNEPRYSPAAMLIKGRLVTGACFAINRHLIDTIGILDENFELAVEDVDYCLSSMEVNLKVIYNGTLEAIHIEGGTRGNTIGDISEEHRFKEQLGLQYLFEKWQGVDFGNFTRERQG